MVDQRFKESIGVVRGAAELLIAWAALTFPLALGTAGMVVPILIVVFAGVELWSIFNSPPGRPLL